MILLSSFKCGAIRVAPVSGALSEADQEWAANSEEGTLGHSNVNSIQLLQQRGCVSGETRTRQGFRAASEFHTSCGYGPKSRLLPNVTIEPVRR
jgi:hypothetical protein